MHTEEAELSSSLQGVLGLDNGTKLKIHYSVLLKYSQLGLKTLFIARYYRNSLPSPSSTNSALQRGDLGSGWWLDLVGWF